MHKGYGGKCCHFIYLNIDEVVDKVPKHPMTLTNTHKHKQAMTNTTLLQTQVTSNNCGIRRGSGCSLRAPSSNSRPRRWLSRCLCLMRIGHWPDHLPSSCSLGWWCQCFAAEREESQSHAEQSADECSAPPPHPSGVLSPSGEYPFSHRRP
jgi:hypothetical protein